MARQKKTKEDSWVAPDGTEISTVTIGSESLGEFDPMTPSPEGWYIDTTSLPTIEEESLGFFHNRGLDIPEYATALSAGFDLRASLEYGKTVKLYDANNQFVERNIKLSNKIHLHPGERALIPTGLHANIPDCFYMSISSRSGTSWKKGLILTNGQAVIDADYVDEIMVSVTNNSGVTVAIEDGERIAQGMLHFVDRMPFKKLTSRPSPKTDRQGGFGSTGTK